jgi:hypothetical protein
LLHGDRDLLEVYIGGERTGGLYLTLPVHRLDRLIGQLRAVRGSVAGSFGPTPPSSGFGTEPAGRGRVTGRRADGEEGDEEKL